MTMMDSKSDRRLRVTIVGGGSTAHTLIPLLSGAGHSVSILTRRPNEWSREVESQYQSVHGEVLGVYKGRLDTASDNPSRVIPQADVIILCMPVSKYRIALHQIAPHIDPTRKVRIGTIYGQGGFNWMVEEIKRKFDLKHVGYFAVGLVPWICRTIEFGKTGVMYGFKEVNLVAVSPRDDFELLNHLILNDISERWFQKGAFRPVSNFLSLTLSVDNQIIHPTRYYGLFIRYGGQWSSAKEIPYFYRDYDELSADLLRQADRDYTVIRDAIKSRYPHWNFEYMLDYLALERLSYNWAITDIRETIVSSTSLGAIQTPVIQSASGGWVIDINHRFFTDDIYYGICIAKWMAEKMDLDVPCIDRILNWAQKIRGERIVQDGKLVPDSESLTKEFNSGIPSVYGFRSIDDIVD